MRLRPAVEGEDGDRGAVEARLVCTGQRQDLGRRDKRSSRSPSGSQPAGGSPPHSERVVSLSGGSGRGFLDGTVTFELAVT